MSALYVLGFVARLNASLWRHRINFVPLNLPAIALLGGFGFAALNSAIEGARNDPTPLKVTIAQIGGEPNPLQSYVSVTGVDFPVAIYQYGEKSSSGTVTKIAKS
jgi:hypothetical protein